MGATEGPNGCICITVSPPLSTAGLNWVHQQWWSGSSQYQQGWQLIQTQRCKTSPRVTSANQASLSSANTTAWFSGWLLGSREDWGFRDVPHALLFLSPPSSAQGDLPPSVPSCGHILELRAWTLCTRCWCFGRKCLWKDDTQTQEKQHMGMYQSSLLLRGCRLIFLVPALPFIYDGETSL